MITIKDVAAHAGVAPSTVSKYLNGGCVLEENASAIREAIEALDYRVNPFARSLKTQRSLTIGVLLPDMIAPFYNVVVGAMEKVLRARGYHCLISCYNTDHGLERENLQFLLSTGVDGLVYAPENLSADEFLELTEKSGVPIVLFDSMIPGANCDAVLADNAGAVRSAMEYLFRIGHRRIGIISGPQAEFTAKERLASYLRTLSENKIIYNDSLVICGDNVFGTGYNGLLAMMELDSPPTAVVSTNYDITVGLITAAKERGIRIPDDVSVFGYDSVEICSMMTPALPVVHQPENEIGQLTAEYLIERLNGSDVPPRITRLKCKIIFS